MFLKILFLLLFFFLLLGDDGKNMSLSWEQTKRTRRSCTVMFLKLSAPLQSGLSKSFQHVLPHCLMCWKQWSRWAKVIKISYCTQKHAAKTHAGLRGTKQNRRISFDCSASVSKISLHMITSAKHQPIMTFMKSYFYSWKSFKGRRSRLVVSVRLELSRTWVQNTFQVEIWTWLIRWRGDVIWTFSLLRALLSFIMNELYSCL